MHLRATTKSADPCARCASGIRNMRSHPTDVKDSSRLRECYRPVEVRRCLGQDTIGFMPRRDVGEHNRRNPGRLPNGGSLSASQMHTVRIVGIVEKSGFHEQQIDADRESDEGL